jgi:proline racemase
MAISLLRRKPSARALAAGVDSLNVVAAGPTWQDASVLPSTIPATDYHTGGEPFRIVADPPVPIPGRTVAERRARAIEDPAVQGLRAVLCSEPRGHADMYGGFIVPPDDQGADLGVLFWHKDGFSTACGHGTIALGVWAVETGRVAAPETGSADVVIDVPSGRVTARVHREDARVVAVDFVNVPSWVVARDVPVTTTLGEARVTVAYGGAIYATLPAAQLGLAVTPERLGDLIALGRQIKWALNDAEQAIHPTDPRLNGIYGTIWFDDLGDAAGQVHQRNVTGQNADVPGEAVAAHGHAVAPAAVGGPGVRPAVDVDDVAVAEGGEMVDGQLRAARVGGADDVDGAVAQAAADVHDGQLAGELRELPLLAARSLASGRSEPITYPTGEPS